MSGDEMRERFEKWAKTQDEDFLCPCVTCHNEIYPTIWQAAFREAVRQCANFIESHPDAFRYKNSCKNMAAALRQKYEVGE